MVQNAHMRNVQLQSSIKLPENAFNSVDLNKKGSIVACKVEVREEKRKNHFLRKVPVQYKVNKIKVRINMFVNTNKNRHSSLGRFTPD